MTTRPLVEPMFAAAMHGIELCFLLMGEFVRDARCYVLKRPRIELLTRDVHLSVRIAFGGAGLA